MILITSTKVSNLGRTKKRHGRVQRPVVVIYQKLELRVSSGVPNTEKQMKARGRRPSAFIVSRYSFSKELPIIIVCKQ